MIWTHSTFCRPDHVSVFQLAFLFTWLLSLVASGQESNPAKIDFAKEILPIFQAKCYSCHGPMLRSGGLRLDRREDVLVGGYSQKPLLGGTPETNEIYLRVSSQDPAYRMPKGADPLTAEEISVFHRWVEQGAIWPELASAAGKNQVDWFDQQAWLDYFGLWLEVPGFIFWAWGMLVVMVFLWFAERYRQAAEKGRAWTTGRWFRWLSPLRGFRLAHFFLVATVMGWVLTALVVRGQSLKLQLAANELKIARGNGVSNVASVNSVYGNPPIPQHPGHAPRLKGEYYRGNCERSPKLFNGGNYRTATLRVSLVDSQGREVNYGDHIEPNSLSIRFELERPKGTTPTLYGEGIVKGVFLTSQLVSETPAKPDRPVVRLTETKPGWQWEATVPLNGPNDAAANLLSGLIYVYQGAIDDSNKIRGSLHYGIKYDLQLKELVLQPDSQVWLGSLFWTPTLEHPTLGKVPLKEWFNDKPIPEITGENSVDPLLLGIPEHEKKLKQKL
ncbi:MAG: Planctomycete cytochrome [Planctomycetaceae bacterium]|nr:Planctomycete cytochrome [Planctomycetaceae bacterium]